MAESQHLDSWVGQGVVLEFYGGGERAEGSRDAPLVVRRNRGTLMKVDNKGIIVEAPNGATVYYGWNAIITIRLQPT
jgi:hypothetical protein